MRGIGEGIAFAGLCVASAGLEIYDKDASGLWIVIILWAIFTDWGEKNAKSSDKAEP